MTKDGEIVGLKGTSNGRSCVSHDCCGEHVNLDDLVRFRLSVADIDGKIGNVSSQNEVRVFAAADSAEMIGSEKNCLKTLQFRILGPPPYLRARTRCTFGEANYTGFTVYYSIDKLRPGKVKSLVVSNRLITSPTMARISLRVLCSTF